MNFDFAYFNSWNLNGKILPIEAVILDKEEQPIIGTPLLKLMCEITESRFVMDFLRSLISFEIA